MSSSRRFQLLVLSWVVIAAAQPGFLRGEGLSFLIPVALVPWALAASTQPDGMSRRRAFVQEWLAASLGLFLLMFWMRHLFPWLVPILGLVPALYHAGSGVLLRRMGGMPLAVAAPAAWMLGELARFYMPPPLSFGWWRLGTWTHDLAPLNGSARVWGAIGLTWVCVAFAGYIADLIRGKRSVAVHLCGAGPLVLGLLLGVLTSAPDTKDGPRVLLVQPGIEQDLKKGGMRGEQIWVQMLHATEAGLEEGIDLVCWGETMFPATYVQPEARQAFEDGANFPSYTGVEAKPGYFENMERRIDLWLDRALFGGEGGEEYLEQMGAPAATRGPHGLLGDTAFLTGIRELVTQDGELRHRNSVGLFTANGLAGIAGKVHLVPAAEDPGVFVSLPLVPGIMESVGGFLPDFIAPPRVETLPLGEWVIGASVCYDQIFDDPYADAAGEVDLHVMVTNEAWYVDSAEMDHMIAFARLDAISTGRSVVRAANSGVSCVLDPEGRVLGRVEDESGAYKMVAGHLLMTVPVPVERKETLWARTHRAQPFAWGGLALLLVLFGGRFGSNPAKREG